MDLAAKGHIANVQVISFTYRLGRWYPIHFMFSAQRFGVPWLQSFIVSTWWNNHANGCCYIAWTQTSSSHANFWSSTMKIGATKSSCSQTMCSPWRWCFDWMLKRPILNLVTGICETFNQTLYPWRSRSTGTYAYSMKIPARSPCEYDFCPRWDRFVLVSEEFKQFPGRRYVNWSTRSNMPYPNIIAFWISTSRGPTFG